MRVFRHISLRVVAVIAVLLSIAAITGVLTVRSGWFREYVRARVIQEIERATGGHADLGQFTFDWEHLTAHLTGVVVHGTEPPEEAPLMRVEAVAVGLRLLSAVERRVDLESLEVVRPQVHVSVYADGSTNLPGAGPGSNTTWAEELLNLHVGHY